MTNVSLTIENFATVPGGIAVVWVLMHLIDTAYPRLTGRQKVFTQTAVCTGWAILAGILFLAGNWQTRAQQAIVLLFAVASAQTFLYEATQKLLPPTIADPIPDVQRYVIPGPDPSVPLPTNATQERPTIDPIAVALKTEATAAQQAFASYTEQGDPNGRI